MNLGRSQFQNGDPFQDNGSINWSLVTTAQFGREEAGRLSLPSHDDPHE
jgi:hypothetical protein